MAAMTFRVFEERAERERAAELERRRLIAELELLEMYDRVRSRLGHDYGCGQRGAELIRRRRVLGELLAGYVGPHGRELAEAWARVGAPRLARAEGQRFRHLTPSTLRTRTAWRQVEGMVARRRKRGVFLLDAERRARGGELERLRAELAGLDPETPEHRATLDRVAVLVRERAEGRR